MEQQSQLFHSDLILPMLYNCQVFTSEDYHLLMQGNSKGYEQCWEEHIPASQVSIFS